MGKPAQIGEIRDWGGDKYRKVSEGRWERIVGEGEIPASPEEREFTRPGATAPGRVGKLARALRRAGGSVAGVVRAVRERGVVGAAKHAASTTAAAVVDTTNKLAKPLERAGYSPRAARAIAAVAATVAVSPASFSLLLGAAGVLPMGVAAAVPGAGEAGVLIGGAIAVRDPLGAGRRLAAKIRERREREKARVKEVEELKRKYAGQFHGGGMHTYHRFGAAMPVGTVVTRKDGQYRKVGEGKWERVKSTKPAAKPAAESAAKPAAKSAAKSAAKRPVAKSVTDPQAQAHYESMIGGESAAAAQALKRLTPGQLRGLIEANPEIKRHLKGGSVTKAQAVSAVQAAAAEQRGRIGKLPSDDRTPTITAVDVQSLSPSGARTLAKRIFDRARSIYQEGQRTLPPVQQNELRRELEEDTMALVRMFSPQQRRQVAAAIGAGSGSLTDFRWRLAGALS